jgi:DNA (cytosine-5)-methyltransferase 1
MITIGSLFSGIGGIELGLEKTGGFKTEWFVENNLYARFILRKHWPDTPIYKDIRKVNFYETPRVDILTGGFPCQDISNAGNRKGITGERSGLWKEYLRAIKEIKPKVAFIENVSALRNRGLHTVLKDLAEAGYNAEWHTLRASDVGASHRRERLFILAYPNITGKGEYSYPNISQEEDLWWHSKGYVFTGCGYSKPTEDVADSNPEGLERCKDGNNTKEWQSSQELKSRSLAMFRERNKRETWATDSGILRVANGIPHRVDRIKCLGNAVVPQCAEFFAERINEIIESQGVETKCQ